MARPTRSSSNQRPRAEPVGRRREAAPAVTDRPTALAGGAAVPALALGLLVVAAYGPALRAGFIWDDDAYVTANATLRAVDGSGASGSSRAPSRSTTRSPSRASGSTTTSGVSYEAALVARPRSAQTHYDLATALAARARTADAITHYREALRLRPDWPQALDGLAASYAAAGQWEAAIGAAERAVQQATAAGEREAAAAIGERLARYRARGVGR